jgi:hypothetical protein
MRNACATMLTSEQDAVSATMDDVSQNVKVAVRYCSLCTLSFFASNRCSSSQTIHRIRPQSDDERASNQGDCVHKVSNEPQVPTSLHPRCATRLFWRTSLTWASAQVIVGKDRFFTYDDVFDTDASQELVFTTCVRPLVDR